jgi:hypothetical protein
MQYQKIYITHICKYAINLIYKDLDIEHDCASQAGEIRTRTCQGNERSRAEIGLVIERTRARDVNVGSHT